jgi:hypothetical protein
MYEIKTDLINRIKMYENDWDSLLNIYLQSQFTEKTYTQIAKCSDTSMNIFRRIVRDICTVYKQPAKRLLPAENKRWDELQKELKLDRLMMGAHRYAKAGSVSFLMVRAVPDTEKIVVRLLKPDCCWVEEDPEIPGEIIKFAYLVKIKKNERTVQDVWVTYTTETVSLCDKSGKVLSKNPFADGEPVERENKYGMIPVVAFHAETPLDGFWNINYNKDAYEANLKIGMLNTYGNYLVKTQSFKQIVISADQIDEELKGQILDPLFPLKLSPGATATTLDLNTRLEAIESYIRYKIFGIANNYGISSENFSLSRQRASGFAIKISNHALEEIREADIPLCTDVERDLYRIIAKVNNTERGAEELPDETIQFTPGEVSFPEEWTTEQTRWEFEFSNGISNQIDYLLSRNPAMTRQDAQSRLAMIAEENKTVKPKKTALEVLSGKSQ